MSATHFLVVCIGSAFGGLLRYGVSLITNSSGYDQHFWPTLMVNLIGSLCIGIAFAISIKYSWSQEMNLFLIVGLLGGFTTFSSYSLDILRLFQNGLWQVALAYLLTSLIGGVLLAWIGYSLIKN